ncbi:hypothetical protein FRACYDRAFT_260308 [Fragilariopsis cylindrus CCMP1102]|uniref:tRNA:m(4)X modification enzyme TRM13 n=1 Tax=Fragilariopsis cylindrus CCMP1102 TaxID=635003 RepID=A0A1E7FQI2_9STRA|nr:hypothetical protein FRACYDRAFT_260308 [Fragilariopsis cylindrus CCMP1102]|eukprot:OEU20374.1 hypothetical protein FRACYDRAFT_260308 [Fragilariopsis cylindrus CCMP1102]
MVKRAAICLDSSGEPQPPEGWDRCCAYLGQHKGRFCRQHPASGKKYCGNHQHLEEKAAADISYGRKRIPCPIDPSHTIYSHNLKKHIRICPTAKKKKLEEEEPHFQRNDRIGKDNIANCGYDDDVSAITCQDIHDAIALKDLSQPEIDAGIIKGFQTHAIKIRIKKSKPLLFLEMGAGRGMLGLAVTGLSAACGIDTHFCMIDKAGSRSKADTAFRSITENADTSYIKLDEVNWCRLCCDLAHVTLPAVLDDDKYKEAKVVVIAKHLCGAGTDLALKALEPIKHRVDSLLIATCCHGICDYQHYVGRDILRDIMEGKDCDNKDSTIPLFGSSEFDLLRRWCAATVATREGKPRACVDDTECLEDDDSEHKNVFVENDTNGNSEKTSVSYVVRQLNLSCGIQGLGRACQRLIDYGRSKYIQQQIFQNDDERTIVNLSHYVAPDVTPQNAILWAYRK